jgi:cell division protease FtsH
MGSPLPGNNPAGLSYSQLLQAIEKGQVKDLLLSPARREVRVQFRDGRRTSVAVFSNDTMLLRTAEKARVPLSVRDDRSEAMLAGLVANGLLVLLLLAALALPLGPGGQQGHGLRTQPAPHPAGGCTGGAF